MRTQALGHGLVAPSQRALPPFVLCRPRALAELRTALAEHPDATLAAGTTDLFARIREGLVPRVVVSLRGVPELAGVECSAGVLRLGAGLTHHAGSRSDEVGSAVPGLAAAWASIATVRIRRRATLGGNLMARRTRYELPVILGALNATAEFLDGRALPVRDLWDADPAGCLTAVRVPTADLLEFGYDRSLRPVTTVAVAIRRTATGRQVTATIGSEYSRPVTVTADRSGTELVGLGREIAAELPAAIADWNGSAEYRRHLAAVQVDRLLARAAAGQSDGSSAGPGARR